MRKGLFNGAIFCNKISGQAVEEKIQPFINIPC
jgi:hypothetical protein